MIIRVNKIQQLLNDLCSSERVKLSICLYLHSSLSCKFKLNESIIQIEREYNAIDSMLILDISMEEGKIDNNSCNTFTYLIRCCFIDTHTVVIK